MKFAKRVTVLRRGKCIKTVDTTRFNSDDLAQLMIDSSCALPVVEQARERGQTIIKLANICTKSTNKHKALADINLEISEGEIVGVAGISGSGQAELGMLIAGLLKQTSGSISVLDHEKLQSLSCYIPGEQKLAYAGSLSVAENSFLRNVNNRSSQVLGFVRSSLMRQQARAIIDKFEITPSSSGVAAHALSGGNLQRLIVGRELATPTKIIVADNPCAGLDVAMSLRIRQELRLSANEGRGVLLISPDLDELIATCDRIVVMFNGSLNGTLRADQFDYQSLANMMGGRRDLSPMNGNK